MNKNTIEVLDLPNELRCFKTAKELTVLHAASNSHSIRFYLNYNQYLIGYESEANKVYFEDEDNLSAKRIHETDKESDEQTNKNTKLAIIFGLFFIFVTIFTMCMCLIFLNSFFESKLPYLCSMAAICSGLSLSSVVMLISIETPKKAKSKHSAEHMMVNFIEKHKRMPHSLEELKTASRFSYACGTRDRVESCARVTAQLLISTVLAYLSEFLFNSQSARCICYLIVYFVVYILIGYLTQSDKCLYFLIKPLKRLYNYAGQLGNTTRKVQDEDLKLAYSVCSVWIYLVYPEFYKDDGKDLGM